MGFWRLYVHSRQSNSRLKSVESGFDAEGCERQFDTIVASTCDAVWPDGSFRRSFVSGIEAMASEMEM